MSTLFVSDLHLDAGHPQIGEQFLQFLGQVTGDVDALYILGDLFESWVGDDDPQPEKTRVAAAIRRLADDGLPCFFMHGNRDFLVGEAFAAEAGLELLSEETVIDLHGEPVLLMHGDSLCTDDAEYQAFRQTVRDLQWQAQFLSMPLDQRLEMAKAARARSSERNAQLADDIMDVNQGAVAEAMRRNGVNQLLHGHTHRPAIHEFDLDGVDARRIVLGDWYTQGSVVTWSTTGPALHALPRI